MSYKQSTKERLLSKLADKAKNSNNEKMIESALNSEFMKEYEKEFKVAANSSEKKEFTRNEQIERLVKNYTFWQSRMPVIDKTNIDNSYMKTKEKMCKEAMAELLDKAEDQKILGQVKSSLKLL
jgi:hypothetical protein